MESIKYSHGIHSNDLDRVNILLYQLNPESSPVSIDWINEVEKNAIIFTARNENGELVGMATLIIINKLFCKTSSCEDVVVDDNYRGQGVGKTLMMNLIKKSKELNIKEIDLTSNPTREVAIALYQKIGFQKRDTNLYRLKTN